MDKKKPKQGFWEQLFSQSAPQPTPIDPNTGLPMVQGAPPQGSTGANPPRIDPEAFRRFKESSGF